MVFIFIFSLFISIPQYSYSLLISGVETSDQWERHSPPEETTQLVQAKWNHQEISCKTQHLAPTNKVCDNLMNKSSSFVADSVCSEVSIFTAPSQVQWAPGTQCERKNHFTNDETEPFHKSYNFLHHQESHRRALHLHTQWKGENTPLWYSLDYFMVYNNLSKFLSLLTNDVSV